LDKLLKIKTLLTEKKLTQQDFANKIGVSKPTVINIFNGRSKIDIDLIEKIAEVLSVPVGYFFEGGEVQVKRKEDGNCETCRDKERIIAGLERENELLREINEGLKNKNK